MLVIIKREISVPADEVWNVISDFQNVHKFQPFVNNVDLLSKKDKGIGATRRCHFYDGTDLVEKVVHWDDAKKNFIIDIDFEASNVSIPVKSNRIAMSIRDLGNNQSEATFEANFVPKFGPLGAIMGVVMMKPLMKKLFSQVLKGLDDHIITGKLVGKDGVLGELIQAGA